jgi:hypothetical protein
LARTVRYSVPQYRFGLRLSTVRAFLQPKTIEDHSKKRISRDEERGERESVCFQILYALDRFHQILQHVLPTSWKTIRRHLCLVHGSEYFDRLPLDVQHVAAICQIWISHGCLRLLPFTFTIAITVTTGICPDRRSCPGDRCAFPQRP